VSINAYRLKRWSFYSGRTFKAGVSIHAQLIVSDGLSKLVDVLPVLASIARISVLNILHFDVPSKHQSRTGTLTLEPGQLHLWCRVLQ
jgi:hypothetical protein